MKSVKFTFLFSLALILIPSCLMASGTAAGYCEKGNQTVSVGGLTSTTKVQKSYPSCTVTVYIYGTMTLATLFDNNSGHHLSNPFTATSDGQWGFFAANNIYSIVLSGAGFAAPFTLNPYSISDPATSVSGSGTFTHLPRWTGTTSLGDSVITQTGSLIAIPDAGYGTFTVGTDVISAPTFWDKSHDRFGASFSSLDTSEFGLLVETLNTAHTWTGLHENDGIAVLSQDAATNTSGVPGGAVALDARAGTRAGATYSNSFAGYFEADLANGAVTGNNGLTAVEIGLVDYNSGNDQPLVGHYDTKMGLQLVAGEAGSLSPSTVAEFITDGHSTWHKGILAWQGAFTGDTSNDAFIELQTTVNGPALFQVHTTGQTVVGDETNAASLGNFNSTYYGTIAADGYTTVYGSGGTLSGQKHMLYMFSDTATSKHRIGATRYNNTVGYWPLTLETNGGNEAMMLTNDPFIQLTTSYTGSNKSAAGTVALRNNAGVLEVSSNGGAWLSASISGSGTTGSIPIWTSSSALGSSDITKIGSGAMVLGTAGNGGSLANYDQTVYGSHTASGYFSVFGSGGTLDAQEHVLYMFSDVGTSKHRIGSTRYNNSVSYWPLSLETSGISRLSVETTGQLIVDPTDVISPGTAAIAIHQPSNGIGFASYEAVTSNASDDTLEIYAKRTATRTLVMTIDGSDSSSQTGLSLFDQSGTRSRVLIGDCTVAGGTHKCLYFN